MAIIFGLVFWVTSVLYWWKFMQNATAILRMEGVFHGSTPFPKKSQVLTGSRSVWQMMVCLGIHFRFLGLLFWTSTRTEPFSWDNFCAWSPKSGLFPFASFPIRGSFLLSLRNVENKSCSSYCRHLWQKLASPPWTQAFSSVCLIFSNAHFLFLQAQLIHLILSAVLLIVLSSEMLL